MLEHTLFHTHINTHWLKHFSFKEIRKKTLTFHCFAHPTSNKPVARNFHIHLIRKLTETASNNSQSLHFIYNLNHKLNYFVPHHTNKPSSDFSNLMMTMLIKNGLPFFRVVIARFAPRALLQHVCQLCFIGSTEADTNLGSCSLLFRIAMRMMNNGRTVRTIPVALTSRWCMAMWLVLILGLIDSSQANWW